MKVVILAGGRGTRLAEETELRPKPMVEVGGIPILHHIMTHYASHDFRHFVLALGYRGDDIRRYIQDSVEPQRPSPNGDGGAPTWFVESIDTGESTETGGRIKRLRPYVGDATFMLTYGDGVSNVDLGELVAFHRSHGKLATLTAVHPPPRFGRLDIRAGSVISFEEKPGHDGGWVNGGFFVLEPGIFDYIDADETKWEREPLERLARDGELMAYHHSSFWQCMDTLNDKKILDEMWRTGQAPWKVSV